jgi:hypothetical protein
MRSRDDNIDIEPPQSFSHHTPTQVINIARFFVILVYRSTMFLCYHGTYRYSPADVVVELDFMAPHCNVVVDATVTSARMNTSVPQIGTRLPFRGVLHWELSKASLRRTSALPLYLAHLRFNRFITTIPLLWRMRGYSRLWQPRLIA